MSRISVARRGSLAKPTTAAVGPQFARPSADVAVPGGMTIVPGPTVFSAINEVTADDANYVQSGNTGGDLVKVRLATITTPAGGSTHTLRVRAKASAAATGTVAVALMSAGGTTTWKSSTSVGSLTTGFTDYNVVLTAGEAAAISSYVNLEMWLLMTAGTLNSVYVSHAYLGTT